MKFFITSFFFLLPIANAGTYYLNPGDAIQLGSDQVFCGTVNPTPPYQCLETCQYFDSFKKVCLYKTKCEYTDACVKGTQCEHWDTFKGKCHSEVSELHCKGLNSFCTESCTYFDTFKKVCNYKTSCVYGAGCTFQTFCEKWDSFKNVCLSESKKSSCN